MKDAAALLGISYNIMYGKYRELFGPLSKKRSSIHQILFESDHDEGCTEVTSCPYQEEDQSMCNKDIQSEEDFDEGEGDSMPTPYTTRSGRRTQLIISKDKIDESYLSKEINFKCHDGENEQNKKKLRIRRKGDPSTEELFANETEAEALQLQKDFITNEAVKKAGSKVSFKKRAKLYQSIIRCQPDQF